jgi:hypothetical protein
MFYGTYMLAELGRRLGRTLVTAIGLAIGIGLVITVRALSQDRSGSMRSTMSI